MTSARLVSGMKLNACKTKTMMVSRPRTMHPQSLPLTIGGTVLKDSDELDKLEVKFNSKITFQRHFCSFRSSFSKTLYLEEVLAIIP